MAGELNLTPQRGRNAWDAGSMKRSPSGERWTSAAGGVALAAVGAALAVAGGRMAYRAVRAGGGARVRGRDDLVDDESEQSFPASDSPSWTPTSGSHARG